MSCSSMAQSATDAMKNELTCALCQDVYDEPHALIPCLHSFCLECVLHIPKNSRDDSLICPICRSKSDSYCRNFTLQNLIDIISKLEEQLQTEATVATAVSTKSTTATTPTTVTTSIKAVTITAESRETSRTSSDLLTLHRYPVSESGDSSKRPCRSCVSGNSTGYTCVIPITDEQQDGFGHILCGYCSEYMPARGFGGNEPALNQCCSFCGVVSCSEYWDCTNRSELAKLYILSELNSISDWVRAVDSIESKEDGHLNLTEISLLTLYLDECGLTLEDAWATCLADLNEGYYTAPIMRRMTSLGMEIYNTRRLPNYSLQTDISDNVYSDTDEEDEDYYDRISEDGVLPSRFLRACYTCTATIVNGQFYGYWKDAIRTGSVRLRRERCPQGTRCQAQWRTDTHAQRLSHIETDEPQV